MSLRQQNLPQLTGIFRVAHRINEFTRASCRQLAGRSLACRGMALCLAGALAIAETGMAGAATAAPENSRTDTVTPPPLNWHSLELQGAGITASITTRIELTRLSAAASRSTLVDGPEQLSQRRATPPLLELVVTSRIRPLLGAGIETRSRLWFNADDGLPLQLIRTSRGSKPARKLYRFGSRQVYRLRSRPADRAERDKAPAHWSRISESFYPLPDPDQQCPAVLESSQLLYLLTSTGPALSEVPGTLCVFDRKHVYRVNLQVRGRERLDVDYLESAAGRESRITRTTDALHVVLTGKPPGKDPDDMAPFSFLGLQGEIHLLLSEPGRIPYRIRGRVPGFGSIELELEKLAR